MKLTIIVKRRGVNIIIQIALVRNPLSNNYVATIKRWCHQKWAKDPSNICHESKHFWTLKVSVWWQRQIYHEEELRSFQAQNSFGQIE